MLFFWIAKYFLKKSQKFLTFANFSPKIGTFLEQKATLSDILPFVKVSGKQGFQLFNELCFASNPFDEWFRFHCFLVFVANRVQSYNKFLTYARDWVKKFSDLRSDILQKSALFGTFPHFSALFGTFPHFLAPE